MLKTPFGNPISLITSANRFAVSGVNSDGFAITQFPITNAGATFHDNR